MKKTIEFIPKVLILFCLSTVFTTNAFSISYHNFSLGPSIEYELPPNDPQVFSNIFFWPIKATCTIISHHTESPLYIELLRKSGTINNIQLSEGDSLVLIVTRGEKFKITASSGAQVELLNQTEKTMIASCSVG